MIIKKLIFLFCLLVSMSIYSQNSLEEMKIDIKKYNIRTLKKPIGEVDVEIKVYFTKEGMQISFIIPNQERFNQTFTWEEYFKTY